ncbi:MAG TPA: protein kinase, partial [Kofleriaceae bacterium]|nr:protein kinase [Kofleriaceae bacterium]
METRTLPSGAEWSAERLELGARMARYELRSVVGAGGLGVVFEARDPELDRTVAVKILRTRSEVGAQGQSRLRREGQTMARLTHPNVIRVYDVGVAHDHVFVAMEFVDGGTLAEWLKEAPRSPQEIMASFVQAGRGLAAAHDAGLVHRDFKPSNVLVGRDGRVLVTDFGLARAAVAGGSEDAVGEPPIFSPLATVTHTGQRVGTPAFMAPEQHAGVAVDGRADQFSFCVALWRALFGAPPYEGSSVDQLVSSIARGALTLPGPEEAARVSPAVRAALERGLKSSPADRFGSMSELLAALEARPRRPRWQRWAAASGAATVAAALGWLALGQPEPAAAVDPCAAQVDRFAGVWDGRARAAVQAAFAATGQRYAEASFREVARQLDARRGAWESMRRQSCEATRVRGEQSDTMMDLRAACLDRRLGELAAFVSELGKADAESVGRAGQEVSRVGDPTACADVAALARRAPLPPDAARRQAIATVEREIAAARARAYAGHPRDVAGQMDGLVARARATDYAPVLGQSLALAAEVQVKVDQHVRAEPLFRQALLAAEAGGDDHLRFDCEAELITLYGWQLERLDEGKRHTEQARALHARLGADPRRAARLARSEAEFLWWAGQYAEAHLRAQEAVDVFTRLDPAGADLARALHLRAVIEDEMRQDEKTLATEALARPIAERALGVEHPQVALMLMATGGALRRLGRLDEARKVTRRALVILEAAYGPEHSMVGSGFGNLATIDMADGKFEDAIASLRRTLAIDQKALGPEHSRVALTHELLGTALSRAGGHEREAVAELDRAIQIHTTRFGADHPSTAESQKKLGQHYLRVGKPALARAALVEAVRALDASQGPHSSMAARPLTSLGDAELALKHPAAATAAYQRALDVLGDSAG